MPARESGSTQDTNSGVVSLRLLFLTKVLVKPNVQWTKWRFDGLFYG